MMIIDRQLEDAFRTLVTDNDAITTAAHAARHVGGGRWRNLATPARNAAHRLVESGEFEFVNCDKSATQLGSVRVRRAANM